MPAYTILFILRRIRRGEYDFIEDFTLKNKFTLTYSRFVYHFHIFYLNSSTVTHSFKIHDKRLRLYYCEINRPRYFAKSYQFSFSQAFVLPRLFVKY